MLGLGVSVRVNVRVGVRVEVMPWLWLWLERHSRIGYETPGYEKVRVRSVGRSRKHDFMYDFTCFVCLLCCLFA